jgi:hypothetical protein
MDSKTAQQLRSTYRCRLRRSGVAWTCAAWSPLVYHLVRLHLTVGGFKEDGSSLSRPAARCKARAQCVGPVYGDLDLENRHKADRRIVLQG